MLVDISFNITDKKFSGCDSELREIIERAKKNNTIPIFVGLDYCTSRTCVNLAKSYGTVSTVGIHPTSSSKYFDVGCLNPLFEEDCVVAVGECGLDYDRLMLSDKCSQKKIFLAQLDLGGECYFLHSRSCHRDFMEMISDYKIKGVVHSFTGALEEAEELVRKGFFIGINGCSVKTQEGLEIIKNLPLECLLVETDAPYCRIGRNHAGFKYVKTEFHELKILKKRNEPCCTVQIIEVISGVTGMECDVIIEIMRNNAVRLYGSKLEEKILSWK